MRFFDRRLGRFLTPKEARTDMRIRYGTIDFGVEGLERHDDEPEVMLIHFVSEEAHDIMLLLNGFIIGEEDSLDDAAERRLSNLGWRLSLALHTPLDVRRLEIAEWVERGSPIGDSLAEWARTVAPKSREAVTAQPE